MKKEMTSRQRQINAIRGKEVDRIPCSPRIGAYLKSRYQSYDVETVIKFNKIYKHDPVFQMMPGLVNPVDSVYFDSSYTKDIKVDYKETANGDMKIVERTISTPAGKLKDIIHVPPSNGKYGVSPNPVKREFLIKDASDIEKLRYVLPDPKKHLNLVNFNETEDKLKNEGLTQLFLRSPLDHLAGDARGIENLMIDYYDDRELFDKIMDFFTQYVMDTTKVCLEKGAVNFFVSWYYSSLSTGWSPEILRQKFIPVLRKHIDLIHSYDATYDFYDDGKMMDILEDYISCKPDVIETLTPPTVGDIDLVKAKKLAGDKVTLKGYVDIIYVMQKGTEKQVRDTVIDALSICAPNGRFILGSSDSFREGTPEINIKTYFDTAMEYGSRFL